MAAKTIVSKQGAMFTALNRKGDAIIDARVARLLKAAKDLNLDTKTK